jgi:hypothetical protein
MGEVRNGYKILIRMPKGKKPLRTPGYRWEDNIVACRPVAKW